jgi:hypothetical protein
MTDPRSSSPLRHLDISDDVAAADMVAEKARALTAAYERIEELQGALKGLLGLLQAIENNQRGVSQTVRDSLRSNTLVSDAEDLLR